MLLLPGCAQLLLQEMDAVWGQGDIKHLLTAAAPLVGLSAHHPFATKTSDTLAECFFITSFCGRAG